MPEVKTVDNNKEKDADLLKNYREIGIHALNASALFLSKKNKIPSSHFNNDIGNIISD